MGNLFNKSSGNKLKRILASGLVGLALCTAVNYSHAAPLSGSLHDLTSNPAYIASGGSGMCEACHAVHRSFELVLWQRDLTPDASGADELCLDCHDGTPPVWADEARDVSRFFGSRHEFSNTAVAPRGGCSACHDLHLADEGSLGHEGSETSSVRMWTRDISQEFSELYQKRELGQSASIRSDYLIGSTALCYDCHSGNYLDSSPDTDFDFGDIPQDIAFAGDRQALPGGAAGYYELPDGREPDDPLDAPDYTDVAASPDVHIPGGHYVVTAMDSGSMNDNYAVRTPSGRLIYEISVGDKIPCELCHDPHMGELDPVSDDEVFFRREIYGGEDSISINNDSYFTGMAFKSSSASRAGQGIGEDDGTGREMCLWCHGSSDWDGTTLSNSAGINPLIVTTGDPILTVYGIKVRTPAHPDGSPSFPPPDTIWSHRSNSVQPCTDCHGHNDVHLPGEGCLACHSAAKSAEREMPAEGLALGISPADFDADGHGNTAWGLQQGRECVYCHLSTGDHHPSTTLDTINNPYRLRTYGPGISNEVCLVCHGAAGPGIALDDAGTALNAANSVMKVDTAHRGVRHAGSDGGRWCWDCHNPHGNGMFTENAALIWERPALASSPSTSLLVTPSGNAVLFTLLTGRGTDYARLYTFNGICQVCHTDPALEYHVVGDASKNGHMNTPAGGSVCTSCHEHEDAFQGPVCYDCHGDGAGDNWPDGAPVIGYPDRQGSHQKHVDAIGSGNGSCGTCHPGNPPNNHLNLSATGASQAEVHQMDLDGNATADAWTGSRFRNIAGILDMDGMYDPATNACSNIDCHGNVLTPDWYAPVVVADSQPPVWGTDSGITASDTGTGGSLLVSWNTAVDAYPSDPVTYDLFMATANSPAAVFTGPPVYTALPVTTTLVNGLVNGTDYYYGVRASDSWTTPNITTNTDISTGVAPVPPVPAAPCSNVNETFDTDTLGTNWLVQADGSSFPWTISGGNLMMAAGSGDSSDPPRLTLNYVNLNHSAQNYNMTIDAHVIDDDYVAFFFYANQAADRGYAVILSEEAGKGHGIYRVEGPSLSGLADLTLLSPFDNQPVDSGGAGSDYTISIQVRTTAAGHVVVSAWYEQIGGNLGVAAPATDTAPNRSSGTIGLATGDLADDGQSYIRNIILVCSTGGSGTCTVDPAGTYVDAENFNLLFPGTNAHFSVATSLGPYIGSGNIQTYGTANMNDTSGDRMDYYFNFPAPASTYYMWVRGRGLDATSDSVHIGGHYVTNGRILVDDIRDAWFWSREFSPFPIPGATNAISFPAGAGTISMWASELGTLIDGFYLSTDPNPPPGLTSGPGASYLGTVPVGSTIINPSGCWPAGDVVPPLWAGGMSGIAVSDPGAGGTLVISWNAAVDAATPPVTYSLYRSTLQADVFSSPDNSWQGLGTTSIVDTGLTNNQTYWYGVRAADSNSPTENVTGNTDTASGIPTGSGVSLTCTSCHQSPPVLPENAGSHGSHADTDGDYTDCDNCHPGASAYTTAHQDGAGQLGFTAVPYTAVYGTVQLTVNDGSADLYVDADGYGILTGSAGDAVDDGTCTNVSCHGAAAPVWGGSLPCGTCHGKTQAQEDRSSYADTDDHPQGAPAFDLAGGSRADAVGKHLEHMNVSYFQLGTSCGLCHSGAGVQDTTRHGDGTVNLSFNAIAGSTAFYDDATSTCGSLDPGRCHGNNIWDPASTLQCTDCHGGPTPSAGVSYASPHTDMGRGYTCEGCHTSHTGGAVTVPNLSSVGISYAAGGVAMGGSQAAGATEAQICWGCHDSLAVPVSEWQTTRNDTNGPWPDYDYGILHDNTGSWGSRVPTSNWVNAWWDSPSFRYKTERIQSTHAANAVGGVAGVDPVAQIRCSYCHDVHDTMTGSPSGSPYLRGTWMQNPYLEDGAPRWDVGGDQHSYAQNQSYGAVPRANRGVSTSHLNTSGRPAVWTTELGGYWIDQNSGFPTRDDASFDTPEETAGLCELCHGDGDGVWSPAEIDSIDQFPANNWFGGNGHANAVIGGSGAASPMATNIMTQSGRGNSFDCAAPGVFNGDDLWDRACMGYFGQASGNELYGVRNNDEASWFYRSRDRRSGVFPIAENPDEARRARFAYDINRGAGFEWGNWLAPADPPLTQDNATIDDRYHQFTCSKCHNPHASRLPRLIVTNCLDVDKNTYDDQTAFDGRQGFTNDADWTTGANRPYTDLVQAPGNRELSYLTTAQNCHRSVGPGTGWNRVTPW